MLLSPKRLQQRAWRTEYTFRLIKKLLNESSHKSIEWMREREAILTPFSFALFKVIKQQEQLGGVSCISYAPKNLAKKDVPGTDQERLIVYLHGGGYVIGSAKGYRVTMAKLSLALQSKVIGVDYRLAPEFEIPAAQDDCVSVINALLGDERTQGKKIIIMGDSAGAALCLSTLISLKALNRHRAIHACVLISPWLVATHQEQLELKHQQSDILDGEILTHWTSTILTNEPQQGAFLDLSTMDVADLPPLYIQAAGAEVFTQQIDSFVDRLASENVNFHYDCFENQFHVFQTFSPFICEADEALEKIADYLKTVP